MMDQISKLKENRQEQLDPLGGSDGNAWPYIIGFILSLAFTLIPYYLVTREISFNTSLLWIVLLFATLQMCIQGVFFLHIGRGPTPIYNLFFMISTIVTVLIVVGASIWIMDNLKYNMTPEDTSAYIIQDEGIASLNNEKTNICQIIPNNLELEILNNQAYPSFLQASRCDSLTIYNKDNEKHTYILRELGEPELKSSYNIIDVRANRDESISLYRAGNYELVDKDSGVASAQITISASDRDSTSD